MDQIIVSVSGLSSDEKQAVNKALAKITGCKEMECQSSKAIFFYAPCPAIPNTISWDYDQHEKKPTHTPQEIIAMAEQLNTKRKVRADFDKSQPITVNVKGCSEDVKKQVQQAFFDVGLRWGFSGGEHNLLGKDIYTNTSSDGRVESRLMWASCGSSSHAKRITPAEFFAMVYEDEPQGHPHAELMMAYAEDAKTNAEPWKLWQSRNWQQKPDESSWIDCKFMPEWDIHCEYRRKPKTHLVHGVEVPDLRIKPDPDKGYYAPHVTIDNLVVEFCNDGDHFDKHLISHNLCYEHTEAGKQAAILHAKAMLGIA